MLPDSIGTTLSGEIATNHGWSVKRVEGYVDGQSFRLRAARPPNYAIVGIDDYCRGFCEGYFERKKAVSEK